MKILVQLLIILTLIGATPAAANPEDIPWRYLIGPTPPYNVLRVSKAEVNKACAHFKYTKGIGCAKPEKNHCTIYIARDSELPSGWYSGVLRHELAHCRGWPWNHPR